MRSIKLTVLVFIVLSSLCGFSQIKENNNIYQHILEQVKDRLKNNEPIDHERLMAEVASDIRVKNWLEAHTQSSKKAINDVRFNSLNQISASSIAEKAGRVFLSKAFFDSIPMPELSFNESTAGYAEVNAAIFSDLEAHLEQVDQIFEDAGISALFDSHKIPSEDGGYTELMFINPDKLTKLIRPELDEAMIAEGAYKRHVKLLNEAEDILQAELLSMEKQIYEWYLKASPNLELAFSPEDEGWENKVSRAIILRICQAKTYQSQSLIWKNKLESLSVLSQLTAKLFSTVSWNSVAARKSNLNNPLIQMAQREMTIRARLDLLLFSAGIIQNGSKLSDKNYQRTIAGSF